MTSKRALLLPGWQQPDFWPLVPPPWPPICRRRRRIDADRNISLKLEYRYTRLDNFKKAFTSCECEEDEDETEREGFRAKVDSSRQISTPRP